MRVKIEVVPLIGLSTTFKQESPGVLRHGRYEYSRGGNPTRECLEECVAKLENGKYCFSYASGLAATMSLVEAVLQVISLPIIMSKNIFLLLKNTSVNTLVIGLEGQRLFFGAKTALEGQSFCGEST